MCKHRIYRVYWIKLREHTDILTEGYVGITKHSIAYRLSQHFNSNRPVGSILREIGKEDIECVEVCRGTKEEAIEKEYQLRSKRYTGWNIMAGGNMFTVVCKECGAHLPKGYRNVRMLCSSCNEDDGRFLKGSIPHNAGLGEKYILIDPEGAIYTPEVFTRFCKEHDLNPQNLRKVAKGTRKHHMGWTATKVI
jgi:predicted GIY-YIG superfamily endonuclease